MAKFTPSGLGWWRDLPDPRDYTPDHKSVVDLLAAINRPSRRGRSLPSKVDLRTGDHGEFFPVVEDQGSLNCSPVFAVLSVVEYFERRSVGRTLEASRLFLYKMARKLLRREGDTGIDLRTTLKAMVRFGAPPEEFWPYDPAKFDLEPQDPSLFGYAKDFAWIRYLRLDQRNSDGHATLNTVKSFLASQVPIVFGFCVPRSLSASTNIPYRPTYDAIRGGQAVVAVGYDDTRLTSTRGALLVRSSWGESWSDRGHGWLPYAYVEQQMAVDFWVVLSKKWFQPAG